MYFERDTDCYSEFDLGKFQAYALQQNAQLVVSPDKIEVRVIQSGRVLMYAKYGDTIYVPINGKSIPIEEVDNELSHVASDLADIMRSSLAIFINRIA